MDVRSSDGCPRPAPAGLEGRARDWRRWALAATVALVAGCRHPGPAERMGGAGPRPAAWAQGRIRSVDARRGFVVVECDLMPATGQRMRVVADGRMAGWVRVTSRRRGAWWAAEIEDGEPRVGDWVVGGGAPSED